MNTSINLNLLPKTIILVVGEKHHSHSVISGVTRNLFRATATFNIHKVSSVAPFIMQTFGLPYATKNNYILIGEKRDTTFHLQVLRDASDHTVISVATIINNL